MNVKLCDVVQTLLRNSCVSVVLPLKNACISINTSIYKYITATVLQFYCCSQQMHTA